VRAGLHIRTIAAMLAELALCGLTSWLALTWWHPLTVVLAMIVIATRQHALFILFHDAVHYQVAASHRVNDIITNLLIGVPQLVPVQLYRRLHLRHHGTLGSDADPERLLLYRGQPWQYHALAAWPLVRQLAGDLLLVNNIRTLIHFQRELRDPASKLALPPGRLPPELFLNQALFGAALVAFALVDLTTFLRFVLLWFVPLVTLTQAIQKVRSFAEHAPIDAAELSYSWRPGLFGRLVLWPYHINYHREHHTHPRVPWYRLPATFPDAVQRPGRELPRLLWKRLSAADGPPRTPTPPPPPTR